MRTAVERLLFMCIDAEQNFNKQQKRKRKKRNKQRFRKHSHFASTVCELRLRSTVVDYEFRRELSTNIYHKNISNKLKNDKNIFLIDDKFDRWRRCKFGRRPDTDRVESKATPQQRKHFSFLSCRLTTFEKRSQSMKT